MDHPDAPLEALTKFAVYLVARIEALETLLIQKGIATKEEIREALAPTQKSLAIVDRSVLPSDAAGFDSALREVLERLRRRHGERLR
jgi:hypothetical protein